MLTKIGQTFAKIKYVLNYMKDVIKRKFTYGYKAAEHNSKIQTNIVGEMKIGGEQATTKEEKKLSGRHKRVKQEDITSINHFKYKDELVVNEVIRTNKEEDISIVMQQIEQELSEALMEWKCTKLAYEQALGFEQVDYCIYKMMAAEQKYRMILIKARAIKGEWSKIEGDLI